MDLSDLRALLYGLHAILRLHTIQEDESYLSLSDDAAPPHPCPQATHAQGPTAMSLAPVPAGQRPAKT